MPRKSQGPRRISLRDAVRAAAQAVAIPDSADVVVVGGGAAGLVAAIVAAESGASVVAVESSLECGRTILATGNGRCNISNTDLSPEVYNDPDFVRAVFKDNAEHLICDCFAKCGLALVEEGQGRLFPLSRQASSVREVLLERAQRAGVCLAPAHEVTSITHSPTDWVIAWEKGSIQAKTTIIAVGGRSELASTLGLDYKKTQPILCPLECEAPTGVSLKSLNGRRAHAHVKLLCDNKVIAETEGEVLFRAYGLSGICIFDLSRLSHPGDVIGLDLTCGLPGEEASKLARAAGGLAGIVDPLIARVLGSDPEIARNLRFSVVGPTEIEHAQAWRGGLVTSQFSPDTLEAKDAPGLFAAGEAFDVDGPCGGYNLSWAWMSGIIAGTNAARRALDAG